MDECIDGWMDGSMDGFMDVVTDFGCSVLGCHVQQAALETRTTSSILSCP